MPHQTVLCIANPSAGHYSPSVRSTLQTECQRVGFDCLVTETVQLSSGAIVIEWPPIDVTAVVIIGGDGTINTVVADMYRRQLSHLPIGIIPSGTVNVLALELGLNNRSIRDMCQALADQSGRYIDVGFINDNPFLMSVSSGLDSMAVKQTSPQVKRWLGRYAYVVATMPLLFTMNRSPQISVTVNHHTYHGNWVIVANTRYYAGRYQLCANSSISDGQLDIIICNLKSVRSCLDALIRFQRNTLLTHPDCFVVHAESAAIQSVVPYQVDGEYVPTISTKSLISVRKNELKVLA